MRHNNAYRKLGRDTAHRIAMLKNLSRSLIKNDRIETTLTRAKELRKFVEKIITLGKKGQLHHRRMAFASLRDNELVAKLFNEIAPKYKDRAGGYTRIIKTAIRRGDSSLMAIIELV